MFFSLIVFVHEFGHFIFARLFKVAVHEFSIGMGPAIWKTKKSETVYSLRMIPIGGFCKMEGEDEKSESENSFNKKSWYKRCIILIAGGLMNILLGFVMCCAMVLCQKNISSVIVDRVELNSPIENFLQSGDKIVKINNSKIHIKRDIEFEFSKIGADDYYDLTINRRGKTIVKSVKPNVYEFGNNNFTCVGFIPKILKINLFNLIREGFYLTFWAIKLVLISIKMLISGALNLNEMSGVVGAANMLGKAAKTGIVDLLFLSSFISINIGLFNLLPFPALDGGRVLFIIIELIRRKPIKAEHEGIVHFIGFALFILLMIFATWNDITRIFLH
jgi:regulator of sigma E protease